MLAGASLIALMQTATPAAADPVTWKQSPDDSTYDNESNWNAGTLPTGQAHFGASDTTSISITTHEAVGGWTFDVGAPAYTITDIFGQFHFTGAGIVINGGSLALIINDTVWFDNSSSAGSAAITNDGILNFTTTSSAGTATITNNRDLQFYDSSSAGSATITNAGSLFFNDNSTPGNAQIIGADSSAVTDLSNSSGPAGDHKLTVGSLQGLGYFLLGSNQLTVGSNNLDTVLDGVIADCVVGGHVCLAGTTGGSLVKVGSGTLTLSGANTYSGATTVDAGTLSVNGSIASSSLTTVNAGATLGGTGTVGNTSINGGTLAPGNSIGTLTVAGNLEFTAASTYAVDISPSNADRVNVAGTATLAGASVNASFANGSYIAKKYTILNAIGGVNGTFGALANTNLPSSFTSTLSYDANNVYLDLALVYSTPAGALSSNQNAVGNALTGYFNRNGGIPLAFGALTPTGLTQASGETAAGAQQSAFTAATQFVGTLSDPTMAGRGASAPAAMGFAEEEGARTRAPGSEQDAYAMMTKALPRAASFVPHWSLWVAGFGGTQTTDGNAASGSNSSSSRIAGAAVGADYWLSPQTVAGFALAGGATSSSVVLGGTGRSDLFQLGGFVRHEVGSRYITASAAYGWQGVTTERAVGAEQLRAQFNANSYTARLEGGNRFQTPWLGGVALTPYAAAQVTYLDLPAYAESAVAGAGTFALAYAAKGVTAPRTELGLRGDRSFALKDGELILRGRAAWAHDSNTERAASATFQSLPGASFVVNGARPAADAALTTAEAEWRFAGGISVGATFEGEFSDVTRSYAGKGVVRYTW